LFLTKRTSTHRLASKIHVLDRLYRVGADTGQNAHAVPLQFFRDHKVERWINCRQHRLATAK
jgi:putative component of toxin-antitoxin plasmid stabilization module